MHEWWAKWPDQKFWLEATDRKDIGADLHAPELDESGKVNWRYTLFKQARLGEIVLHYDSGSEPNGIVGWSIIAGAPCAGEITWGARGTYAREKGVTPHARAGYTIPLSEFQRLARPVTLAQIRNLVPAIGSLIADLKRKYGEPLYFPFELSGKRPLRPLQGYAFKVPREFLALFPQLSDMLASTDVTAEAEPIATRNPVWSRDELILVLDLYFLNLASPSGKQSREVIELSRVLNRMRPRVGGEVGGSFRNANGVYMKMMNFRRFDPSFTRDGRVGLEWGNKDEEIVWNKFAGDRERLSQIARAIKATVEQESIALAPQEDEGGVEAPEGRVLTRLHCYRERNRKLVEQRKARALRDHGKLTCEACDFDFEERYGARGVGYIEAHHTKALATLMESSTTKLEDLSALVLKLPPHDPFPKAVAFN